jgi:tetraacyldisaccharide 4'-kinase
MMSPGMNIQNYLDSPQSKFGYNLLSILLYPVSLLFKIIVIIRRSMYRNDLLQSSKLGHPVISVGNIVTGGTGKTPFEIYLIKLCRELNLKPLLLSRGYGSSLQEPVVIQVDRTDSRSDLPDEIKMLTELFPDLLIAYGKDRTSAYNLACKSHKFDIVILDDGFQHMQIKRDLEILMLDSRRPYGAGRMLPSGNLREPGSSIKQADVVVFNSKGNEGNDVPELVGFRGELILKGKFVVVGMKHLQSGEESGLTQSEWKNPGVVTAIADPGSFASLLQAKGMSVRKLFQFRDHHHFTPDDLDIIQQSCSENLIDVLLTTEKDAVKLRKICFEKPDIYVIKIQFCLTEDEDVLIRRITELAENS